MAWFFVGVKVFLGVTACCLLVLTSSIDGFPDKLLFFYLDWLCWAGPESFCPLRNLVVEFKNMFVHMCMATSSMWSFDTTEDMMFFIGSSGMVSTFLLLLLFPFSMVLFLSKDRLGLSNSSPSVLALYLSIFSKELKAWLLVFLINLELGLAELSLLWGAFMGEGSLLFFIWNDKQKI